MGAPVRVGLLGAGRIGHRHGRTLAFNIPACELAIVCDPIAERAREVADLTRTQWTENPSTVMDDPSIDAVVIASSTSSHAELIEAAAAAGKQIFCEKPVTLDLESTDRAIAAADRAGMRLQVGFQRRFDKGFSAAKQEIASGHVGKVEMIRDTMRDPGPPPPEYLPTSGGLYRDMSIHNFDNVRWLMGDEPTEVYAAGANLVDPMFLETGDIDTSIVTIRFAGGGLAVIDNSRRSGFGYDVRTEIFGAGGALFVGYSRDTPLLRLSSEGIISDHVHWFLERFDDAYVAELQAFIDSIVNDAAPPVTGEDGRAAMALAVAAEMSLGSKRPVMMSEVQEATST